MKFKIALLLSLLSTTTLAKVDVSPLFIQLSDAMAYAKKGEIAKSQQNLTALQQDFIKFESHHSNAGKSVEQALSQALKTTDENTLATLSKSLYAFEKEQNPVDYAAKHQAFVAQMPPLYEKLQQAVQTKNIGNIKKAARNFGMNWAKHEKAVREISLSHYGQFERSLGLMRIAVTAENPEMAKVETRVAELGEAMKAFSQFQMK
ncbi:Fe2+/Pb2+ permease [Actinobacillus vicugnae]|uniref:Fe2+/Pb2+ permease n=1 Tax=Actinobacillus vicugnae TaxID=2573093 RepID=UPI001240ADF0|nr:Fe2+/Pb2+ permease [Actinobacillus vicugnae]